MMTKLKCKAEKRVLRHGLLAGVKAVVVEATCPHCGNPVKAVLFGPVEPYPKQIVHDCNKR